MFKIDNVNVYGLENAIRVAKYPMATDVDKLTSEVTPRTKGLASSDIGSGHGQFLVGCLVQFDMTFSIKMSVELERYHFIDFISSQSTMHRITKLDIRKQCNEYVDAVIINRLQELVDEYNAMENKNSDEAKLQYLRVLYNVPVGFELTAGLTTNYQQLKTMYFQRHNHRLPEWRQFCAWVETLPMFKELILDPMEEKKNK